MVGTDIPELRRDLSDQQFCHVSGELVRDRVQRHGTDCFHWQPWRLCLKPVRLEGQKGLYDDRPAAAVLSLRPGLNSFLCSDVELEPCRHSCRSCPDAYLAHPPICPLDVDRLLQRYPNGA